MNTFLLLSGFLFSGLCISAQHVAVGVKIGGVLTDTYPDVSSSDRILTDQSKAYVIGPSVDIEFWKGLGLEVDALYRRVGYDFHGKMSPNSLAYNRERNDSWEFPILARYRLPLASSFRLFIVSGYVRRAVFTSGYSVILSTTYPYTDSYGGNGFVAGGGMELGTRHLRFTPEFRYTRWGQGLKFTNDNVMAYSTQNQAAILFGVSWR